MKRERNEQGARMEWPWDEHEGGMKTNSGRNDYGEKTK